MRYTEGDNPPAAVVEYMAKNNIQKPSGVPAPAASVAQQPVAKDDGGDLDPGDSGPRVTKLQEELAERGFYKGKIDGQFGQTTSQAVTAFKQSKGFGPGPKAGKKVLDDLGIGL